LRKQRKHPVVVLEIKPLVLPPLVQRYKGGRDVLRCPPRPQLEGAAASPHRHTDLLHVRRRGEELRGEDMGPQVPVGVNPQKPLANRCENGRLRYGVGVEVMQLHPVVVREHPHEAAHWHPKPPLMKGDETDHVCNTPLVTHNGYHQKKHHPPNLLNTRGVIKKEKYSKIRQHLL
jgi:hypothetical protein